jgi:hypothetical protein
MKLSVLILLALLMCDCGSYSKVPVTLDENCNDIFILSQLICDHFRKTNDRDISLNELVLNDPLQRISNSFEKIETSYGGHITVYYKFSDSRDISRIRLSDKEREIINKVKWIVKEPKKGYNGEIQLDYGERFYNIRKIIIY